MNGLELLVLSATFTYSVVSYHSIHRHSSNNSTSTYSNLNKTSTNAKVSSGSSSAFPITKRSSTSSTANTLVSWPFSTNSASCPAQQIKSSLAISMPNVIPTIVSLPVHLNEWIISSRLIIMLDLWSTVLITGWRRIRIRCPVQVWIC